MPRAKPQSAPPERDPHVSTDSQVRLVGTASSSRLQSVERPLCLHARQQHALLVANLFTTRDSLSNTIVARLFGRHAGQGSSFVDGSPVRANQARRCSFARRH